MSRTSTELGTLSTGRAGFGFGSPEPNGVTAVEDRRCHPPHGVSTGALRSCISSRDPGPEFRGSCTEGPSSSVSICLPASSAGVSSAGKRKPSSRRKAHSMPCVPKISSIRPTAAEWLRRKERAISSPRTSINSECRSSTAGSKGRDLHDRPLSRAARILEPERLRPFEAVVAAVRHDGLRCDPGGRVRYAVSGPRESAGLGNHAVAGALRRTSFEAREECRA